MSMSVSGLVTGGIGETAAVAGGLSFTSGAGFSSALDAALSGALTQTDGTDAAEELSGAQSGGTEEAGDEAAQKAAAARQAALEYLQKWIVTGGAPEDLDRERVVTEDGDKDGDGIPDFLQRSAPEHALEIMSQTIADPENEGKIHVAVTKIDAEGKPKSTRIMSFDNGDGENRGELTPERAAEKNDGRDAPKRPGSSKASPDRRDEKTGDEEDKAV